MNPFQSKDNELKANEYPADLFVPPQTEIEKQNNISLTQILPWLAFDNIIQYLIDCSSDFITRNDGNNLQLRMFW